MSDYQHYLKEKERINDLIESGYRIKEVIENLSGSFVQFEKETKGEQDIKELHIVTADARKYFSVMMIRQNQG